MLRLTLVLLVAIYAVLIIFSDAPPEGIVRAPQLASTAPGDPTAPEEDPALHETTDGRLVLTTQAGDELTIDTVVQPGDLPTDTTPTGSAAVPADTPTTEAPNADPPPATDPSVERLRVAGDRVNFRAGPSTDDAILAALTRGEVVELIERVDDGWAHLRVVATGLTGYMSEDFLEPVN